MKDRKDYLHTLSELKMRQSLPLDAKVRMSQQRIKEWVSAFGVDGVYVSFSGGKDSTVLLHLVRELYPTVPAVFCDTGLEYPEIREFVKGFDNVTWLRPKMNFKKVIETFGYPIISKDISQCVHDVARQAEHQNCDKRQTTSWDRSFNPESEHSKKYPDFSRVKFDYLNDAPFLISHRCCDVMKKRPAKAYEKATNKHPMLGTLAVESSLRTTQWLRYGCNAFDAARPVSKPLSFWTDQDILQYILGNNLSICSVYGDIVEASSQGYLFDEPEKRLETTGCYSTGCMFCMFGCHLEGSPSRFERMKETHPKQYDYIMRPKEQGGLGYKQVIDWLNAHGNLHIKY